MKPRDRRSDDDEGASFSAGWLLVVSAAITLGLLLATGALGLGLGNDRVCDCGEGAGAPAAGVAPAPAGPPDLARNISTRMIVEALDLGLHDLAQAVSQRAQAQAGTDPQVMLDIATLKNMIELQDIKAHNRAVREMLDRCLGERGAGSS